MLQKAIWFPPSHDGKWKNPRIVYLSEKGFSNDVYVAVCDQYFSKDGEDYGLRDALEGRYSHALRQHIQPYSDELWAACEKLIIDRKNTQADLLKRRNELMEGLERIL